MVARLCFALIAFCASAAQVAHAQPADKIPRLGLLSIGSATAQAGVIEAFRDGLRERGWVEGRNVRIEYRFAENHFDRLPQLAQELVRLKVEVIVATPAAAAVAASRATNTIPIVMASVSNPIELGLVESFGRPGGNVTGLAALAEEIYGKRLQILKEALPDARRVAILSNPNSTTQRISMDGLKAAARSLQLSLQPLAVRSPDDFDAAFAAMASNGAEALLVVADPLFGTHSKRLVALAAKHRLPSIHATKGEFEPGGLIYYGYSITEQVRQAGIYIDKILRGAKPGDLAVAMPTRYELLVNLKTAKKLGVSIPQSLLLRADQVIE
jgi:putative ABC transport system substrate-binding protein